METFSKLFSNDAREFPFVQDLNPLIIDVHYKENTI